MFVVQDTGCKRIELAEARRRLSSALPVALAFRPDSRPAAYQLHKLWRHAGPCQPDDEAVLRMFADAPAGNARVYPARQGESARALTAASFVAGAARHGVRRMTLSFGIRATFVIEVSSVWF